MLIKWDKIGLIDAKWKKSGEKSQEPILWLKKLDKALWPNMNGSSFHLYVSHRTFTFPA